MEKTTLKERASKRIEEWKKDVDHLKGQLEHTKEESKETFEKQKKSMMWIDFFFQDGAER